MARCIVLPVFQPEFPENTKPFASLLSFRRRRRKVACDERLDPHLVGGFQLQPLSVFDPAVEPPYGG
jgi:hypothetical protein